VRSAKASNSIGLLMLILLLLSLTTATARPQAMWGQRCPVWRLATALYRWITIDKRWKRKAPSRFSLVICIMCLPRSHHDTVLLNRLRIGHTRLMHSYLLSGDDLPECGTCQCPLTVKHILVECVDLKDVQNKHFVASWAFFWLLFVFILA